MIIQGSNEPIYIIFQDINDLPEGDMSVSLRNEIEELKHWNKADLSVIDNGYTYIAPITQAESKAWEAGPCVVEVKYVDHWDNIMFHSQEDTIFPWGDSRTLA